jgi:hypothetical protein
LADVSEELTAFVIRVMNELYAEKSGARKSSGHAYGEREQESQ